LIVFDEDIVEELYVFGGEADFGGVIFELFNEGAVRIDGVEIIDERFFEHKKMNEVSIFHRRINLLLQLAGNGIDTPDVLDEMRNASVDNTEDNVLDRLDLGERPAFKERSIFGDDDDQAVLEYEGAGRGHLKEEIVGSDVTLWSFENQGDMFGLEFKSAGLVRVEGRIEGMLVNF
jgi:hypothetical protein